MSEKEWNKATSGDVVKLEQDQSLEGKYVGLEQSKTYPDSWGFKVETPEGVKCVFVNNIVKDLVASNNIMKGQEVKLTFKGLQKTEDGKKEYKTYDLLFR